MITSQELIRIRQYEGWTQKELAEFLGLSASHIGDCETGRRKLSKAHEMLLDLILRRELDNSCENV